MALSRTVHYHGRLPAHGRLMPFLSIQPVEYVCVRAVWTGHSPSWVPAPRGRRLLKTWSLRECVPSSPILVNEMMTHSFCSQASPGTWHKTR